MIHRLIAIVLLLPLQLTAVDDLFEKGCHAYAAGDFKSAYTLFDSLDQKDPLVWYNMGTAAYKQGDSLNALICWERALKQSSGNFYKECCHTITQVRKELGLPVDKQSIFYSSVAAVSTGVWQVIFLIIWYASMLSLVFLRRKRVSGALLLLNCVLGFLLLTTHQSRHQQMALVVKDESALFAGPDDKFHVIQKLPPVAYLVVEDTKESWYKVKYNHTVGWVPMEAVEVI